MMTALIKTALLVEKHAKLRAIIKSFLDDEKGISVIGEMAGWNGCVAFVQNFRPDVVILDIGLTISTGSELIPQILDIAPQTRVIVYSLNDDRAYIAHARAMGASAFISKRDSISALVQAILD